MKVDPVLIPKLVTAFKRLGCLPCTGEPLFVWGWPISNVFEACLPHPLLPCSSETHSSLPFKVVVMLDHVLPAFLQSLALLLGDTAA